MKYIILMLMLVGCSFEHNVKHIDESTPIQELPQLPIPEEPSEPEEPTPEPIICSVDLHWNLFHPAGFHQILEIKSTDNYHQMKLPSYVQEYLFKFEVKDIYCFKSNLYDRYGVWIMSTNVYCQECIEESK